ncbi:MAG: class I SAM-dependent methyltransferase [Thermoguttaceae bacterium]|jgi:predicted O-methyltransferase YrrM
MLLTKLEQVRRDFIRGFRRIPLNTTPGDAALLRILVEASKAKRGLEIGTATGYGAILMGLGFERNGGELLCIDVDRKMVAIAQDNLKQVRLDHTVTVREGDALAVIPTLRGKFDFVFLDAVKRDYLRYLRAVEPKLKPGALIVADNVIQHRRAMRDFLQAVRHDPRYHSVTLRASELKGDGMTVSYKLA